MRQVLKGLSKSSPISFMAALGLLRVLTEDAGFDVSLGWAKGCAVLEGDWGEEPLPAVLARQMEKRAVAPEWNWAESPKRITPQDYRAACLGCGNDGRALAFMAAFATDTILNNEGFVSSTRLDLTSGNQKLIRDLKKLAQELAVKKKGIAAFESALFGGPYEGQASFGWDPIGVRSHAHEARAPSLSTPPGKKGLVWLAAEGLALHPVIPSRNRARTTGIERIEKTPCYYWPIWDGMLNLEEVRMLRALELKALQNRVGVIECWASEVSQSGKYGILLPAKRLG